MSETRTGGTRPAIEPTVELKASDLPAYCPNPSMPVWNHHPRVFLEVNEEHGAMCPYCGTRYRLAASQRVSAGH